MFARFYDDEYQDIEIECVNCYRKISGKYRTCDYCGKVWDVIDDGTDSNGEAEKSNKCNEISA